MSLRALVLDCDCAAGLETIQSLGRHGVLVHASSTKPDCLATHSRYVASFLAQPSNSEELAAFIVALDGEHHYDLIVPSTEVSLLAMLSPSMPSDVYRRAVLAPAESIRTALNKEASIQLASSLGLPVPPSTIVSAESPLPSSFPVVLKPIHSKQASREGTRDFRVTIARDAAQWRSALLNDYASVTVQQQQYIKGRGVGVELLLADGEPVWHFVHERLHEYPLTGGGSSYRRSIAPDARLVELATKLMRALRWHGVAMVEFKMAPDGTPYFVEINPRLWGSLALAIDSGIDFPAGLLAVATGTAVPPQPKYRVRFRTRNFGRDSEWMKANLRADHSDPLLHTRPHLKSFAEYLLPLTLNESWDFFDPRDFGVTAQSIAQVFRKNFGTLFRAVASRAEKALLTRSQARYVQHLRLRPPQSVLVLCHGNICRSPFSAALLKRLAPDLRVASAGFYPKDNRSSPDFMQRAAREFSVDLSGHRSQRVTAEIVAEYDLVVIMDRRNYRHLKQEFPAALSKTVFLGMLDTPPHLETADPYDLPYDEAVAVCAELEGATSNLAGLLGKSAIPVAEHAAAVR